MTTKHDAPGAPELAQRQGITVAEADDRIAAMVAELTWSNLTRPVLDQMLTSPHVWRAMADIAVQKERLGAHGHGGEWGPSCPTGTLQIKITKKGVLRIGVRLRSGPSTTGPNEVLGRWLDINHVTLPDTVLTAAKGRRLDAYIDPAVAHDVVPGSTMLKSAETRNWGVRFTLNLPFIQPSAEDLAAMRALNDPKAPR